MLARWVVSVRPRRHCCPDPKLATIRRKPAYAFSCRGGARYCGAIGLDVGSKTTRDACHDPVPARRCDITWPDPTRIVGGQRAAVDVGGRRAGARHRAEAGRHADEPVDAGAADPGPRGERPGADADRGQQDLSGADHLFADAGADQGAGEELDDLRRQAGVHVQPARGCDLSRRASVHRRGRGVLGDGVRDDAVQRGRGRCSAWWKRRRRWIR